MKSTLPIKIFSPEAEKFSLRAEILHQKGEKIKALKMWKKSYTTLVKKETGSVEQMASIMFRMGQVTGLNAEIISGTELKKDFLKELGSLADISKMAEVRVEVGAALIENGNYEDALYICLQVLTLSKKMKDIDKIDHAHADLAYLYVKLGIPDKGISHIQKIS